MIRVTLVGTCHLGSGSGSTASESALGPPASIPRVNDWSWKVGLPQHTRSVTLCPVLMPALSLGLAMTLTLRESKSGCTGTSSRFFWARFMLKAKNSSHPLTNVMTPWAESSDPRSSESLRTPEVAHF